MCIPNSAEPYEEDGKWLNNYVKYTLKCNGGLYDSSTKKCVEREKCTTRVLGDMCVEKCPLTHYNKDGECVLVCPEKTFAMIEDENVCKECSKYAI